jgi:hypothetical protein
MWFSVRNICEIKERSRWKVEFYDDDPATVSASSFPMVPIGDIVHERTEALDTQHYPEHIFAYIGLENVESLTGDLIGLADKRGCEILSKSKVFREGDVLYGRLRPNLNKVFLAVRPLMEGVCSGEFYVLIPDQTKVLPRFLRSVLASKYVQTFVRNWQTGSALPRLQLKDLLHVEIPLPDLKMQEELCSLLGNSDVERRAAKETVKKLTVIPMERLEATLETGRLNAKQEDVRREVNGESLRLPDGYFALNKRQRTLGAIRP